MNSSVYVNGRVWTADPAKPSAEAFTDRDGRIVAAGENSDMLAIILSCDVDDIPRSTVLATAMGAAAVYDPGGLLPPASGAVR